MVLSLFVIGRTLTVGFVYYNSRDVESRSPAIIRVHFERIDTPETGGGVTMEICIEVGGPSPSSATCLAVSEGNSLPPECTID